MFTRLTKLVTTVLLLCSSIRLFAQHGDSLKADLQLLKAKLESTHPGLYSYVSKDNLDQLFDSCYQDIHDDTDDRQFYGMVKVLLSAVKDGHLSSNAAPHFAQFIHAQNTYIPILTYFSGDSIFIINSIDNKIPAGSLLRNINSHPAATIRQKLFSHLPSDGYSDTKKALILNQIFYFYYYLAYGYSAGFTVEYITPAGEPKTIALTAVEEKTINTLKPVQKELPLLTATITDDDIGILTIRSFSQQELQQGQYNYPAFLEQSFRKFRQSRIQKLIIDLRGNGGGRDDFGVMLYSYLTKKPFRYYRSLEKDNNQLSGKPGLGIQKAAAQPYEGKVWVLTDGETFSAAAEFCSVAYSNDRAVFIGQETGGRYEGNHSGQMVQITLPCSRVNVWIPTTKYILDVTPPKYPGRGIIPHVPVQASPFEYLRQEDKVMQEGLLQARSR